MGKKKADSNDDFEPLFDYHRVQPANVICLDDDDSDTPVACPAKRRKKLSTAIDDDDDEVKITKVVKCNGKEVDEDWLPPPPKPLNGNLSKLGENSTIKQLRLKKQELASLAKSADDDLQAVEESVKRKIGNSNSQQASFDDTSEKPSKPTCEREKIVISIQAKDETKQFRFFMDQKFERLFKLYADKVKLDLQSLVFCFDGEKISPTTTPEALGMEDDDIIEVHVKKS